MDAKEAISKMIEKGIIEYKDLSCIGYDLDISDTKKKLVTLWHSFLCKYCQENSCQFYEEESSVNPWGQHFHMEALHSVDGILDKYSITEEELLAVIQRSIEIVRSVVKSGADLSLYLEVLVSMLYSFRASGVASTQLSQLDPSPERPEQSDPEETDPSAEPDG